MPLYEYQCAACGERFEVIQKFSDPPVDVCAKCGKGPVNRLLSSPAIQFKGSGWYITDYAQKGKSGGAAEGKADAKKDSSSEAKSESKSDSGSSGSDATKTSDSGTKSPAAKSGSKD